MGCREHLSEDFDASFASLLQRATDDLVADTVDLQVELNAGDSILRSRNLEVHIAIVIFITDDVGQ